jgi:hypothetical protein
MNTEGAIAPSLLKDGQKLSVLHTTTKEKNCTKMKFFALLIPISETDLQ